MMKIFAEKKVGYSCYHSSTRHPSASWNLRKLHEIPACAGMTKVVKLVEMVKRFKLLLGMVLICSLFSCAKDKEKKQPTVEMAYSEAMKSLEEKRYNEAAEKFEKIGDDYPLSRWSIKAGTMAAYAYYKEKKYEEVIKVTDDFIRSNPANDAVSYMQYLKAISYYDLMSDIDRGQDNSQLASYAFRELIARFPASEYAKDARKKLVIVDEHLAGAKMSIGRYNISVRNYVGAIANFNEVIARYKNTNQAPEAYFRLAEIYYKLGMKNEAKKAANDLRKLYPKNFWAFKLKNIE